MKMKNIYYYAHYHQNVKRYYKRRKQDLKTEKQGHLDVRGCTKMVVIMPFGDHPRDGKRKQLTLFVHLYIGIKCNYIISHKIVLL